MQRVMRWRGLALLGVLGIATAACGGQGSGPQATDRPGPTEEQAAPAVTNTGDGTLKFGTLLPATGSLSFLGPPESAGVKLAIQDINAAGGVLGQQVQLTEGDSGDTSTDIANQTTDRLLSENVDAIIGTASSAVTFTVIDKITGAGVIQFSPANTAKTLTEYDDRGLYFRTAPSDILQGQVLGEIIVGDGNTTVGILALQDPYGEGLAEDAAGSITDSGGEVLETIIYDPQAQNFDAEVQQIKAANPDAILVIGFDETARILTTMIEQGIGPDTKAIYGTDGNMGNALGQQFATDPGALEGMRGTTPLSALAPTFTSRLLEIDPGLIDFNYSGEAYDAVTIVALAAEIAGTDQPTAIAEEINGVTKDGEKCPSFSACLALVKAGTDIDYDGITGPLTFTEAGEPGEASYGILEFGADNKLNTTEFRFASL
jgi:ABC-type branched-subunit amino acid transport system substrate-binding protein